jgi:hypothetical protein
MMTEDEFQARLDRMINQLQAAIGAYKGERAMTVWDGERLQGEPPDSERVDERSREIQPFLHGLHPGEQGAILADLLAIWLSGHPAVTHERLIDAHVRGVRRLLPLYIERNRGEEEPT